MSIFLTCVFWHRQVIHSFQVYKNCHLNRKHTINNNQTNRIGQEIRKKKDSLFFWVFFLLLRRVFLVSPQNTLYSYMIHHWSRDRRMIQTKIPFIHSTNVIMWFSFESLVFQKKANSFIHQAKHWMLNEWKNIIIINV